MRKILLSTFLILFTSTFCFAQEVAELGILNDEEINLKQCDFDKAANAVVLLHEANSNYDDRHQLITNHHIRIKILNEKGFSSANVAISYYRKDDFELIDGIEGLTINYNDGTRMETKLERKSIFNQKKTERYGEVIFAFPAIKPGSIIEYKYRSVMKHYGGLRDWDFQEELPVLVSRYTLVLLPNSEFAYRVNKTLDIPIVIKKEGFMGGAYFEMKHIPGLGNEPYMDARKDYLQSAIFQLSSYNMGGSNKKSYMTSWDEVTRELMMSTEFGSQLNKNLSGTEDFIKQIKLLSSTEEKMKQVFDYVRGNMKWNHFYGIYSNDGIKEAWQKKTGSSGDINLALINLLKEAGLEVYPMLVSERFHGKVDKSYPFIDQFNSVFACVVINKIKYYLDATDREIPPHLTPNTILNTTAFLVNRKAGGLVSITNDSSAYKELVLGHIKVEEDGTVNGDVIVKSMDYARIRKLHDYKSEKEKFLTNHFIVSGTTIAGKDLEMVNMENDSLALEQKCKLTGRLNTTGEYSFLPLNLFTGFDFNPFLADERFSNINFGYKRNIIMNISVQLPSSYIVDELPKSVKLTDPDKDIVFVRQIAHDKETNIVSCMIGIEFKKSLYETDFYPVIKEVYKRVFDYLKEPLVLKRK